MTSLYFFKNKTKTTIEKNVPVVKLNIEEEKNTRQMEDDNLKVK